MSETCMYCDEWRTDLNAALNEITRLTAEVAELRKDGWISVDDGLPDEKRKVIVYVNRLNYYPNYISTSFRQDGTWREESGNYHNITHWQPLPTPPAIKSEQKG